MNKRFERYPFDKVEGRGTKQQGRQKVFGGSFLKREKEKAQRAGGRKTFLALALLILSVVLFMSNQEKNVVHAIFLRTQTFLKIKAKSKNNIS